MSALAEPCALKWVNVDAIRTRLEEAPTERRAMPIRVRAAQSRATDANGPPWGISVSSRRHARKRVLYPLASELPTPRGCGQPLASNIS
jgi:hypothetical protein